MKRPVSSGETSVFTGKTIVIDVTSDAPFVISGSHNFSKGGASDGNDENYLSRTARSSTTKRTKKIRAEAKPVIDGKMDDQLGRDSSQGRRKVRQLSEM